MLGRFPVVTTVALQVRTQNPERLSRALLAYILSHPRGRLSFSSLTFVPVESCTFYVDSSSLHWRLRQDPNLSVKSLWISEGIVGQGLNARGFLGCIVAFSDGSQFFFLLQIDHQSTRPRILQCVTCRMSTGKSLWQRRIETKPLSFHKNANASSTVSVLLTIALKQSLTLRDRKTYANFGQYLVVKKPHTQSIDSN